MQKLNNSYYKHMLQEHHPISLKKSSVLFNSKDKNILELIESVFISKIPNYNITPGKIEISNALVDTIVKLYLRIKRKITAIGSNPATVEDWGLNETVADLQNN